MVFLAGAEFADSGIFLQILLLVGGDFGRCFGSAVIAVGKQRAIIWWYILDAVLSWPAILMIPRYGGVARLGSRFFEVFIMVATFITVFKPSAPGRIAPYF